MALWAIKLAKAKRTNDYTSGWQRAEVLGALVNGVFLLALCLSIFLEAVQRFFEPQSIANPMLILAVGAAGLASNILGLLLFHDHGHSHGDGGGGSDQHSHSHVHSNSHSNTHRDLETGQEGVQGATAVAVGNDGNDDNDQDEELQRDTGPVERVLPREFVRRAVRSLSPAPPPLAGTPRSRAAHFSNPETDIHVYPALNRREVVRAAASDSSSASESAIDDDDEDDDEEGAGADANANAGAGSGPETAETTPLIGRPRADSRSWHRNHHHAKRRRQGKGGGHSHQNLNMRGVFLHVLGDALGNVGVMLTALFVQWSPRHAWSAPLTDYADPFISLVITVIIFSSALPLVKSASKILLQGVPKGIVLDEVKEDIASIPGIESVHELHIWQLSDVKLIASLHIQIAFDPATDKGHQYMRLARAVRMCLHAFGVHSVTIQPEYSPSHSASPSCGTAGRPAGGPSAAASSTAASRAATAYGSMATAGRSLGSGPGPDLGPDLDACLLECGDECGSSKCCAPVDVNTVGNGAHGHSH